MDSTQQVTGFSDFGAFLAWFSMRAAARAMRVVELPLHQVHGKGWEVVSDDQGAVAVRSKLGFGQIAGRQVFANNSMREVPDWSQVVWGNDEGGPVLIIHTGEDDNREVLIRALAQPGHAGLWIPKPDGGERNSRVCLGPSANFSFANFRNNAHRVPFGSIITDYELYQPNDPATGAPKVDGKGAPVFATRNVRLKEGFAFQIGSADGARVDGNPERDEGKSNAYLDWAASREVVDPILLAMPERDDYAWLTMPVLRQALRYLQPNDRGGLPTEHLRAVLACLL